MARQRITRKPKELHGRISIKVPQVFALDAPFHIRINGRRWASEGFSGDTMVGQVTRWLQYWTRTGPWHKPNYEGNRMIRVLIKKEQPFELHVVVNPTEPLDVAKIDKEGHYWIGDFDGEKQIDEAVAQVAVYLELEESHA